MQTIVTFMKKLARLAFLILLCAGVIGLALWWWDHRHGSKSANSSNSPQLANQPQLPQASTPRQRRPYTRADIPSAASLNDRIVIEMALSLSEQAQKPQPSIK